MNKFFKSWQLIALVLIVSVTVSCKKDPIPEETLLGGAGNILIETTVKNPDGTSGSSYLQQIPALSGNINNSKGIQIGFSSMVVVLDNDVFVFPAFGVSSTQSLVKYSHTAAGLKKENELQLLPGSAVANITKVNEEKAYMPLYSLGRVWIINPKTMTKIGEIDLKQYAHSDTSADPAYGIIRDGKYYLPLDQINENWMPYEDYRQVDVAVIDIQTDKVLKVTTETTSGLCFPTRPYLKDMIFTTETNDIWIACTGYFGYNPEYIKNGFVCIPSGTDDIDASKSWEISDVNIKGTEHIVRTANGNETEVCYKPAAIYSSKYIGNGKLVAYVCIIEFNGINPYTAKNAMAVEIDLKAKTIEKIEGLPLTDGHSVFIETYKGDAIFASYGEDVSGAFSYNPQTKETKQVLTTEGNLYFMHFFE